MPSSLTIVMYHYVRDLRNSRFPGIKGLQTEKFDGQLDYLTKHYSVCSLAQLAASLRGEATLPPRPCLLTFDDGFSDHFETVFPRLVERGLVGSFFAPAKAVDERIVLDVHKLHFILASVEDYAGLLENILEKVDASRGEFALPSTAGLKTEFGAGNRFDPPDVAFIKRLLQYGLPGKLRSTIIAELFAELVSTDERSFADGLYMDAGQLSRMKEAGMEIGGHGYAHVWLGTLSRGEQENEIRRTVEFLSQVGGEKPEGWAMSYPFGSFNSDTVELLGENGCSLGLTAQAGLVEMPALPFELKRLDTNDLPFSGDAPVSHWTQIS